MKTKTRTKAKVRPTLWWEVIRVIRTISASESATTITGETIGPDDIFVVGIRKDSYSSEEYFVSDDPKVRDWHGTVLIATPLGSNRIHEIRKLREGQAACHQCGQLILNIMELEELPGAWEPKSICLSCHQSINGERQRYLKQLW